jgi:hypothetical protein
MTHRMSVRWLGLSILGAAVAACSGSGAAAQSPMGAGSGTGESTADPAAVITAESFRARLYFLASDALQGRNTPSPGLEVAAAWLASEHQRMGLRPAAEGSYYQRWPYRQIGPDVAEVALTLEGSAGSHALTSAAGVAFRGGAEGALDAELVFAGLGRQLPDGGGVRGKAVVISVPGEPTRNTLAATGRVAQWVQASGGVALVVVLDPSVPQPTLAAFAEEAAAPAWRMGWDLPLPQLFLPRELADRAIPGLAAPLGRAAAGDPFLQPLGGVRLTGTLPASIAVDGLPANVVAMIPGSDPVLRDEYVVLSAHYDHVGVGRPMDGDSIYNGADDNGSGTVGLLEVARAISGMPTAPRRSVLFVHVSGEEKGLLGASWFVDHSPVPVDRMVANLNADMIGGDVHVDSLVVIGKTYSDMGPLVDRLNDSMPELRLTTSDDLWPEQRFFFRSDQFHFMRKEIPSLFFFTGVHDCYHRPCDEVDFVNHDKAARIARLLTHTVLELANRDERPQWVQEGLAEVRQLVGQGR